MGVHGLWKIIEPAHRPVRLETLAHKRLAVDASIWIYQFLKAVRDKEGNALRNSHIVGFFRRICKLLFHGVKPVFVFDGGAPELKRQTIAGRKKRREGRGEDATRTAQRILRLYMKREAAKAAEQRRIRGSNEEPEVPEEEFVYVDELGQTPEQRKRNRQHRKTDQYELPEMEYDMNNLGHPNDPRMMSGEELRQYHDEFEKSKDLESYDYSHMDLDGLDFKSRPATEQYRILSTLRRKSRLRMGISKEQLDRMYPNRMEFSRFQIERVMKRNEFSQRLMDLQGLGGNNKPTLSVARVAGERNKEYALMRNDDEHGGWVMSMGNKGETEGDKSKPIVVDSTQTAPKEEDGDDSEDDEEFETVQIPGVNMPPKFDSNASAAATAELLNLADTQKKRSALYESLKDQSGGRHQAGSVMKRNRPWDNSENPLFLGEDPVDDADSDWEDSLCSTGNADMDNRSLASEDRDLQTAIAMSLERPDDSSAGDDQQPVHAIEPSKQQRVEDDDIYGKGKGKGKATADDIHGKGKGKAIADVLPDEYPEKSPRDIPMEDQDFQRAVAASLRTKGPGDRYSGESSGTTPLSKGPNKALPKPVAGLDLSKSTSFLSKTRNTTSRDEGSTQISSGQVEETPTIEEKASSKSTAKPVEMQEEMQQSLPPWFAGGHRDIRSEMARAREEERVDHEEYRNSMTQERREVIDVEFSSGDDVVMLDSDPRKKEDASAPTPPAEEPSDLDDMDVSFEQEGEMPPDEPTAPEDMEDMDLLQQMEREDQEHARFAAQLNNQSQDKNVANYEQELKSLRSQQKKDLRDADEVTQVMVQECQSLLTLFGLPYITAPMEAEAQCAELLRLNLVDGIVTDDSDVFLFGGTRVYRHMFNDKQTVQCYLTKDLEKEYSLDQKRLISAAHLLGSDYTEGIQHVGPVTATELLAEFADEGGLEGFKQWWIRVQKGVDNASESESKFRKNFRKNAAKIFLPPSFPDPRVDEAYLHAEVDHDPSAFEWGEPDLDGLRKFLMESLGWSKDWTDRTLVPVIQDMNKKLVEGTQANITSFFGGQTGAGAFAPRPRAAGTSARMEKALGNLAKKAKRKRGEDDDEAGDSGEGGDKSGGKSTGPVSMRDAMKKKTRRIEKDTDADTEPMSMHDALKKKKKRKKLPVADSDSDSDSDNSSSFPEESTASEHSDSQDAQPKKIEPISMREAMTRKLQEARERGEAVDPPPSPAPPPPPPARRGRRRTGPRKRPVPRNPRKRRG